MGTRPNVLFTAPHAEFAPFQRVWNPDTNNDYSVQDFSSDEGDEDSGIVTDDIAGDDGKFKDVEVPAFNGEDYFDAKPIGCAKYATYCPIYTSSSLDGFTICEALYGVGG
jgi:hypothetical protein